MTRLRAGSSVLDVGCGTGEFIAALVDRGAHVSGVDPARGMVDHARSIAPTADIRVESWDALPWPTATFDVVMAVNALQFADDTISALTEARRVTRTGGVVAIANWAERALSDLDEIDAALAAEDGEEPTPDGDLRLPGGLEAVLHEAGLEVVEAGTIDVPWTLDGDAALLRAVLLDEESSDAVSSYREVVLRAAQRFLQEDGRYLLNNTFRFVVGRVPEASDAAPSGEEDVRHDE
ncbi:class I SAM-dependent methyltransferase [Labedella endophytica]|uniref:class I SAM-dependent methyltransferase n=1 Tax=Labedella endophytica TaxID=1523160 RepID=UPI001FB6A2FB